ncbi:enolase C-terminal domain-like protein [Alloscardovia macacae]|uniref:L-fuconate dehydratase n=1 Tax=Alloscardovia macacae TaxID=1160091 RepID=A0A261F5M3_9BIFI|nr:enolase C-terminal domain-like protein [Alloscardovia macacae]OZG54333.1 fuconate dehydratase [Alloscardovia macacae]
MSTIAKVTTYDLRFPTSQTLSGSDAMNPDPDYSSAYVVLETSDGDCGYGFVFTIGRGNDVVVTAIDTIARKFIGKRVETYLDQMRLAWDECIHDSQLRWLGPEKGVVHMACGALLSALWDLKARRSRMPLWKLLSSMEPEELVSTLDFRYLTDALTPEEAVDILADKKASADARAHDLIQRGYPGYSTAAGWLGYSDEKMLSLIRSETREKGFQQIKLKVGQNLQDDIRRLSLARQEAGPDIRIAVDANQVWDVPQAIAWIKHLEKYDLAWVEEPTSPDDVLGHAAIQKAIHPLAVATGEQMQSRILYKQYLQAGAFQVMQIDATRVAGPQEIILEYLLAHKYGVRVCPHAGGVGLCEAVVQYAMLDYVSISGQMEDRMVEYVDNQHEYFLEPSRICHGRYQTPLNPGSGIQMNLALCEQYMYAQPRIRTSADDE